MSKEVRKLPLPTPGFMAGSRFAKTPSTSGERIGQAKPVQPRPTTFSKTYQKLPVKVETKPITKPPMKFKSEPNMKSPMKFKVDPNMKPPMKFKVEQKPITKPPMKFKVDSKPILPKSTEQFAQPKLPPFRSYVNTFNKTCQKPPIKAEPIAKMPAKVNENRVPVKKAFSAVKVEPKSVQAPSTSGENFVSAKNFDFNSAKVDQFSARPSIMYVDLRDPVQVKEFVDRKKEYEKRMSLAPGTSRKSPMKVESDEKIESNPPSSSIMKTPLHEEFMPANEFDFSPVRDNLIFPRAPSIMAVNLNDSTERRKFIGMKAEYEKKRMSLAIGSELKCFTPKSTSRTPLQSTENTSSTPPNMKTPLPNTEKFTSAKEFDFSAAKIKPLVRPSIMNIDLFDSAQVKEFLIKKKEYEQQQQRMSMAKPDILNDDCHTPISQTERTSKTHVISSSMPAKLIQPPKFSMEPKLPSNNLFTIEETPKRSSINVQKCNTVGRLPKKVRFAEQLAKIHE